MLHRMDTHLIQYRRRLLAEHLHDANVLPGVEIRRKHTLAQHLVQQAVLRSVDNPILTDRGLLARQGEQRRIRRDQELHRLVVGRQLGEEGQRREDGVLEDLGQARVAQGLVGELGEEDGEGVQALAPDRGGGVAGEGEQDGDEEGPVGGD